MALENELYQTEPNAKYFNLLLLVIPKCKIDCVAIATIYHVHWCQVKHTLILFALFWRESSHINASFFSVLLLSSNVIIVLCITLGYKYMFVFKCIWYHSFSCSLYQPFIYFHLLWGISFFFLKATSRTSSQIRASEKLYYFLPSKRKGTFWCWP